jgi:hypothetical protein
MNDLLEKAEDGAAVVWVMGLRMFPFVSLVLGCNATDV